MFSSIFFSKFSTFYVVQKFNSLVSIVWPKSRPSSSSFLPRLISKYSVVPLFPAQTRRACLIYPQGFLYSSKIILKGSAPLHTSCLTLFGCLSLCKDFSFIQQSCALWLTLLGTLTTTPPTTLAPIVTYTQSFPYISKIENFQGQNLKRWQ